MISNWISWKGIPYQMALLNIAYVGSGRGCFLPHSLVPSEAKLPPTTQGGGAFPNHNRNLLMRNSTIETGTLPAGAPD